MPSLRASGPSATTTYSGNWQLDVGSLNITPSSRLTFSPTPRRASHGSTRLDPDCSSMLYFLSEDTACSHGWERSHASARSLCCFGAVRQSQLRSPSSLFRQSRPAPLLAPTCSALSCSLPS